MSDYTPTTEEVREFIEAADRVIAGMVAGSSAVEAFDRWQAAHDAEVRAGVVAEEPEWEYGWHTGSTVSLIGRREQIDEWLMVRGWKLGEGDWGSRIMQRTAAGPWVPVKQEGADDA